jgi:predicted permease
MDLLRTLLSRCVSFLRRKELDADLDEELRAHIDLSITENMTLGMSPNEARTRALRDFGGLAQIKETYRVRRGLPLLDQIARDLHFALRQLRRSPGFTLTAMLTLALGLGANTTVFSLINALLLRPLPVPHAQQLAFVVSQELDYPEPNDVFSGPMFRAIEKRHDAFHDVAAYWSTQLQIHGSAGNLQVPGAMVSGEFFRALETPPLLGRYLSPQDDRTGSPTGLPAVLSYGFWRSWFNSAPDVIGSKLVIANIPFTVVGVMPSQFIGAQLDRRPNFYIPLATEPIVDAPDNMLDSESASWLRILARRKPGVTFEQANAALNSESDSVLVESIPEASYLQNARERQVHLAALPGSRGLSDLRSTFRKPLVIVFCLCAALLLLACLNLASLLMARAAARERELATRLAIGATRRRLIQQLLTESLVISVLGTIAGLALTPAVSRSLAAVLTSGNRLVYIDTALDMRVFLFAALITLFASILIGLVPALRAASGHLNEQIKNGSHSRSAHDRRRLVPSILMSSEVALALVLAIGAGLLAASLTRLYRTGLGFNPKGLVELEFDMSNQPLEHEALINWYKQFGDALSHQPGVKSVSFAAYPPLGLSWEQHKIKTPFSEGEQTISPNHVSPTYFSTMGIPLLEGRDFNWQDTRASEGKMILNQTAAKLLFPGRSAVGQSVPYARFGKKSFVVIAVVGDTKFKSIREPAPAIIYLAITQSNQRKPGYEALVRVESPAEPLALAVRDLVRRTAPEMPAPAMTSMSSQIDTSITSERMMAMLSVFFAACALLVTAIGLYGTLAYATARRTSEIGIRMALGAQRLQVVSLVFRENAWIAICGCAAGLIAALLVSRTLASFLYGTSTRDPWVLIGSVAALISIASAASLLPAIRAARIDPMEALRTE